MWARLGVVALLAGCSLFGTTSAFDAGGFHEKNSGYRIGYADPAGGHLISPEWRVDNFLYEKGRPSESKSGAAYRAELTWETNSGKEYPIRTVVFDLKLQHRTSRGMVWVRRLPIPASERGRSVDVVAENWANGLSANVSDGFLRARVERRVATRVVESKPATVSNRDAHVVTFEIVDLNQLEMDENAPRTKVRVVFVPGAFKKEAEATTSGAELALPAWLMLGYSQDAAEFDELLPEFEKLVANVQIDAK